MLYNVVVNDWGETTYVPTTLGNVLLIAVIIILLGVAILFAKKRTNTDASSKSFKLTAKQLAFCAMVVALSFVLSNIKLFKFPTGGSITLLSLFVATLAGYWYGVEAGILTGVACGILNLIVDPYVLYPAQLLFDYIFAFGALGLSGLFKDSKHGLVKGYIVGVLGRYIFAVLSGCIFFGMYAWDGWNPVAYSLAYNAIYIFSEAAITLVLFVNPLTGPTLTVLMGQLKKMATSEK